MKLNSTSSAAMFTASLLVAALLGSALSRPAVALTTDEFRRQIEKDWLKQEQYRHAAAPPSTKPGVVDDARGGCDGIKDGKWGFHTGLDENPWWQVDLGKPTPIARIAIWNRCDAASRADRVSVLTSDDGKRWDKVYTHDRGTFFGMTDNKPLEVSLDSVKTRFVRVQLPGKGYLHLDEVEVFGPANPRLNLALNRPADQSSISHWSSDHQAVPVIDLAARLPQVLAHCRRLAAELRAGGVKVDGDLKQAAQLAERAKVVSGADAVQALFFEARWLQRKLALANPLLNQFDTMLITKRVPGSFNHMSDQYYGWWSRPGGGLYLLRNFRGDVPTVECVSGAFKEPGSFLRPALSYDGKKVLFAWCKHYPALATEPDKLNKANVPEDAFYHVFEMNLDGTGLRRLTQGKYDDFDARYLPDGRIVFMSTRRGQFIQAGRASACLTGQKGDLPDIYVRCGGGPERPVAVYTLHTMNADGGDLTAISPFEMFEWEPSVAHDGTILYSRWDYIDRDNMPYMSLWSVNPDGTNPRIVYGNYTRSPHCAFEPRAVPNSNKIVFTASAHHSQTMGSLVLLDPSAGTEGAEPVTRLTPDVAFPEIEGWPRANYASPWPLSERFHLVTWSCEGATHPGPSGWNRWHSVTNALKGMGVYFFDAAGNMELLYRDPEISCMYPLPVMPQSRPPVIPSSVDWSGPQEGRFLLGNVYHGLRNVPRGEVKALRIVAVPPKTHPTMNFPNLGVTRDDPGKCVLGTVPVEADGSAFFRVPAGVIVFFQALDAQGRALQTMRTTTHVQPGQTLSCTGCHDPRNQAPPPTSIIAAARAPSRITVGPEGSWPLRFDQLVQPVLDRQCVSCHAPQSSDKAAAKFDLTPAKAYDALVRYGKPSLADQVWTGYRRGTSIEREGIAMQSQLLALLTDAKGHYGVQLDRDSRERLIVWMDTYAQKIGSFSAAQEKTLEELRAACADLLIEREPKRTAARGPVGGQ